MVKLTKKIMYAAATLACVATVSAFPATVSAYTEGGHTYEWKVGEDGKKYWYMDDVKQGTTGRGAEIFDKESDAWYWLDAIQGGAMATSKDLYQESSAGKCAEKVVSNNGSIDYSLSTGKWVRYDAKGHMIKGWCVGKGEKAVSIAFPTVAKETEDVYYFDPIFGTMAKGYVTIDRVEYYFNPDTGIWDRTIAPLPIEEKGWMHLPQGDFWCENFERQGIAVDKSYRGKEIYDPGTDAWYWLDNVDGGKKAVSKDVYQDSKAGEYSDNKVYKADGSLDLEKSTGKWVRYDKNGHMVKGWSENDNGIYYFDSVYGAMVKKDITIEGKVYKFDPNTGVCTNAPSTQLGADDFDIRKMPSGSTVIEGDLTLTGTGTGYHAKFVVGNAVSAVSFGIQYDTASGNGAVRGKQGLLVENIASNNAGGQSYFWPGNIVVEPGKPAHLMLCIDSVGHCTAYYNYKKIADFDNPGLSSSNGLYARAEACARLEGETVDAKFTNLKVSYPAFPYTAEQIGAPQQFKTTNSCPTMNVECNTFKSIRIFGTVTGIGGQDWDSAYDSVSGYAMLYF